MAFVFKVQVAFVAPLVSLGGPKRHPLPPGRFASKSTRIYTAVDLYVFLHGTKETREATYLESMQTTTADAEAG